MWLEHYASTEKNVLPTVKKQQAGKGEVILQHSSGVMVMM
jgi:hypothetical protein